MGIRGKATTRWAFLARLSVRVLALVLCAALLCVLPAEAQQPKKPRRTSVAARKQAALTQFAKAEKMREALIGRPEKERSRREYSRLIEAYRVVYLKSPTSPKAHESVRTVAELLLEVGRTFNDPRYFGYAVKQYEFLRREYPGSRYRFEALFTIGQIYHQDLEDAAKARATFDEFLKRYPRHSLAEDAKRALDEMDAIAAGQRRKPEAVVTAAAAPAGPEPSEAAPPAANVPKAKRPMVTGVRHWSTGNYTRIAVDVQEEVKYQSGRISDPDRIFFDIPDTRLASELVGKTVEVEDGFLRRIRVAQFQPGITRIVLEVADISDYSAFLLPNPHRLIIDINGKKADSKPAEKAAADAAVAAKPEPAKPVELASAKKEEPLPEVRAKEVAAQPASKPTTAPTYESVAPREKKPEPAPPPARAAKPTSNGERSLIRALGLKIGRIVIDAGHGGHDTGTIGPKGFTEKELVLDVALRLGKLLETKLGAEVVYTREDDTFVPLETRTGIANQQQADLFISIHANASRDRSARGVETYYLNFTSSPEALEVAARENAVSEKSIHELQDLVKKIALKEKIDESREFAGQVQRALRAGMGAAGRDRGVKQAPFIVLIGANMPSILAEISFLSNQLDERLLKTPKHRQKIAESLYKGISSYTEGLSGVKVASRETKSEGQ
jgi:N-acetylmuramoyl-L-alanine amidase